MVIIRANGDNELVGDEVSLATLQRIVGGYIEVVAIPDGALVANEDGYALGLPRNRAASILAAHASGRPMSLVGDVVLLDREELALLD